MLKDFKEKLLDEIITDLGDNFLGSDRNVLQEILNDVIINALHISHRRNNEENITLLKYEIKKCAKALYQQRGTEDVKSLSESGRSSTFVDAIEELRNNIIKSRKRLIP